MSPRRVEPLTEGEDCVARRLVLPRALWDRVDTEARERGLSPETFAARAIEAGVAPIEVETKPAARGRKTRAK